MLDLKVTLEDKKIIDVEIQVNNLRNTEKRLQFYASKLLVEELEGGENYTNIKDVIVIAILDFELTNLPEYHTETIRVSKEHREYEILNCIKYHIIELPKFRKTNKNLSNKLDQWLTFLDYKNKGELEMASKNNKEVRKAIKEVMYLTGDAAEKRLAELREIARINEALFLGAIEEEKKGIIKRNEEEKSKMIKKYEKEKNEIIRKLKEKGISDEEIFEIMSFSKKEIKEK